MATNYIYSSLGTGGTVQAVAADAVVNNHILTVTNGVPMDMRKIESAQLLAAVAETRGVVTVTPTNAASSDFSLVVKQLVNGVQKQVQLSVITAASGSSATTICNEWRSQLSAQGSLLQVVGSGTSTFIITANAGYPIISVSQISLTATAGTVAIVNTTAGVQARGTYAALVAAGVPTTTPIVSGQSYTQFVVTGAVGGVNEVAGAIQQTSTTNVILINEGATNFAALNTRLGEIINGFPAGGSTYPNPEIVAL